MKEKAGNTSHNLDLLHALWYATTNANSSQEAAYIAKNNIIARTKPPHYQVSRGLP